MAGAIAGGHHEKWNGSGYPKGLKGEDIPIAARIAAISDVFDALLSARPYKEPWPLEKALALMKEESGSHFDPVLIDVFLRVLRRSLRYVKSFLIDLFFSSPALHPEFVSIVE